MKNYVQVKCLNPFSYCFFYVDCVERKDNDLVYLGDKFLSKYKVKMHFKNEWEKDELRVIECRVKKKCSVSFKKAMSELMNASLLMKGVDYLDVCDRLEGTV